MHPCNVKIFSTWSLSDQGSSFDELAFALEVNHALAGKSSSRDRRSRRSASPSLLPSPNPTLPTFLKSNFYSHTAGIGAAIALSLAKSGANLALLDLPSSSQETTKTACLNAGVKAVTYDCNVADLESTRKVFGEIEKELGSIE